MSDKNYLQEAQSDAWETCDNFVDEMVQQWKDSGEVSSDLYNDYRNGDSYHHESHVDKSYRLTEAAELLDALSEYEETDNGLWDGQDPREAISTQAAYTYGNAVMGEWAKLIEDINTDLDDMKENMHLSPDCPTTEAQFVAAGERLIRLYVLLGDDRFDGANYDGLQKAAYEAAQTGDRTAALVLADRVQEAGEDTFAKRIREAVSAEAEAEEVEDEAEQEKAQ